MNLQKILKLIISIFICHLAGIIGSFFTMPSIPTWYATLQKPFFNPPNWVFAPVWLTLYTLMGISLFLIWEKGITENTKKALCVFFTQLSLNALWSYAFFGLHSIIFAFVIILSLLLFILLTILKFYKISKTAAYLLIPYIIWVGFASILNLAILVLN